MASNKTKLKTEDRSDLIEDTTVEELRKNGLVEEVEVSAEDPSLKKKKDETEVAPDAAATAVANPALQVAPAPDAEDEEDKAAPTDATAAAIAAAPTADAPKTKAGLINAMYQQMSSMKTEQLTHMYTTLVDAASTVKEDDDSKKPDADEVPAYGATPATDDATKSDSDDADDDDDDDDDNAVEDGDEDEDEKKVAEDTVKTESLDVLLQAEKSLSESFRTSAAALFESTVKTKVAAELKTIESNYKTQLAEEVATVTKTLSEKVDSYMNYVVKNWMEENKVAIEAGLRTEIAEEFINSLKGVFKESYIEVPEGKENMVDTLNTEVSKLEEQLLKATESNIKLSENVSALKRNQIISEASSDLASTEAVKFNSLVEEVDFEDAESFSKKVTSIKESYFRKTVTQSQESENETGFNAATGEEVDLPPAMAAYSNALSRILKS